VGTVQGHKLPLFLNHLPAQYLARRTACIHKEKPAILFGYIGKTRHSNPLCGANTEVWPSADQVPDGTLDLDILDLLDRYLPPQAADGRLP